MYSFVCIMFCSMIIIDVIWLVFVFYGYKEEYVYIDRIKRNWKIWICIYGNKRVILFDISIDVRKKVEYF